MRHGSSKGYGKYGGYWDKCRPDQKKKKAIMDERKSGGCVVCGYKRCLSSLAFHHVNPKLKKHEVCKISRLGWEKFYRELDKCIVMCHNCHSETHTGLHPEYLIEDNVIINDLADNNQMTLSFI